MVPPIENLSNKPVIDVKTGLAELRATINPASENEDANNPTKAKMDEVRLKFDEAKTAAAQADKTTLEELSREIDATDTPLQEFIDNGYFYDEALGFKAEVQQLKTVVAEKIAEPRTTMEKIGSMMEKAGETLGKVMEKIGKIFESMGTGALKGLRSLAEMMGYTSMLAYLDNMIKPREVREIISARFRPKKCVKSDTDTADVARLEAEWAAKLTADSKTAAAYPFSTFCTEKARDLADTKAEYTIADLITAATPPAPPPAPPPNPNDPPKNNDVLTGNETPAEKAEIQRAAHVHVLAKALLESGMPLEHWQQDPRTLKVERKATIPLAAINGETLKNAPAVQYAVDTMANSIKYSLSDEYGKLASKSFTHIGLELDGTTLELEDGNSTFFDEDIVRNFDPVNNPKAAVTMLLNLRSSINGDNIHSPATGNTVPLNGAKEPLTKFLEHLEAAAKEYEGITKA